MQSYRVGIRHEQTAPLIINMSSDSATSEDIKAQNDILLALHHLDPASFPFSALPDGSAKCKLTLIRTGCAATAPKPLFLDGATHGSTFSLPSFAFLIEREVGGKVVDRVLFELGLREVRANNHHTSKL